MPTQIWNLEFEQISKKKNTIFCCKALVGTLLKNALLILVISAQPKTRRLSNKKMLNEQSTACGWASYLSIEKENTVNIKEKD